MKNETEPPDTVLEGVKLLKDWSNILLVVQTGAIGFIGTALDENTNDWAKLAVSISVVCFAASILAAANLLGSLPNVVMKSGTIKDIYDEKGNLCITVRDSAFLQGTFFVLGITWFAFFAVIRGWS